ncbi:CPBP family intramembrane metalloprotease [bacterium]|nr:CPBP family intramembrane metalloprotease [bacterium]
MKETLSSQAGGESSGAPLTSRIFRVAWRLVLFVVIFLALYIPFILPFFLYPDTEYQLLQSSANRALFELLAGLLFLLSAMAMTRYVDRRPLSDLCLRPTRMAAHLLLGSLIGAALLTGIVTVLFLYGAVRIGSCAGLGVEQFLWAALAMFFNTFGQEIMLRGYAQRLLQRNFGPAISIIVAAVIFVLMHWTLLKLESFLLLLNLFGAGIVIGIAFVRSGSIWLPVGMHFGWNTLQGPILGLPVTGINLWSQADVLRLSGSPAVTGGSFGPEGGMVASMFIFVAAWFLMRVWPAHRLLETQAEFS